MSPTIDKSNSSYNPHLYDKHFVKGPTETLDNGINQETN